MSICNHLNLKNIYVLCCKTLIIAAVIFEHFFLYLCPIFECSSFWQNPQNTFFSRTKLLPIFESKMWLEELSDHLLFFTNVNRVLNQRPTHMPCPFTGPKQVPNYFEPVQIFWASPKLWPHLVPLQKLLCCHQNQFYWMQIIFLSGTKNLEQPKTFWDL